MTDDKNIFECLSDQLKLSPEQIKTSAQRGDVDGLMKNVESEKAKQVQSVLSDPEKVKSLMNSPEAQELLRLLDQNQ